MNNSDSEYISLKSNFIIDLNSCLQLHHRLSMFLFILFYICWYVLTGYCRRWTVMVSWCTIFRVIIFFEWQHSLNTIFQQQKKAHFKSCSILLGTQTRYCWYWCALSYMSKNTLPSFPLAQEYMVCRKHTYMRLDGSSKISDRRDMVADFQTKSDIFVFLPSTRAGGLGINLTAADTVSWVGQNVCCQTLLWASVKLHSHNT